MKQVRVCNAFCYCSCFSWAMSLRYHLIAAQTLVCFLKISFPLVASFALIKCACEDGRLSSVHWVDYKCYGIRSFSVIRKKKWNPLPEINVRANGAEWLACWIWSREMKGILPVTKDGKKGREANRLSKIWATVSLAILIQQFNSI